MTTSGSYDFTGYQVLVVGGTRGEGHTIASSFAACGASVTVTGTMMLRSLYDTDLSAFDYESVNLARQDSIDHLAATVEQIDVLVLAATCNLPYGLPPGEQAFIAEATRSGLLGPTFLTRRLRLKLGQSPALGGGCVVNTGAVRTWLELSHTPEAAQAELVESTARSADNWAGLGVRVNSVVQSVRPVLPRQFAPRATSTGGSRVAGGTLVRAQQSGTTDAVADAVLVQASSAASRITGHTLRIS
jgi:3-oxoacyl-[acyl-carrier protein] reductase